MRTFNRALLALFVASCGGGTITLDGGVDAARTDGGPQPIDAATDSGVASDAGTDGGIDAAMVDAGPPCTPTVACAVGFYCHTPDGMCGGDGV